MDGCHVSCSNEPVNGRKGVVEILSLLLLTLYQPIAVPGGKEMW